MSETKFRVGQTVKVVRLLDSMTSRDLLGLVDSAEEVDSLPNGEYNYYVDGYYMHKSELEPKEE